MKKEPKAVGTLGAILIFLLILVVMLFGKLVLEFDTAILLMFVSIITSAIFVFYYGYNWDKMFKDGVVPMTSRAMGAMIILLTVGILIAIWMISGTIPYLMYIGLKALSPRVFLVATAIITSISSLLTGTSWGTGATFGVALMGVAYGLGVPLPIAAGAIVVGSYLGDKISPVSDTTVLAAAVAEVDVIDHIKSMLWTTMPGYIISLIVYAIIGMGISGTIDYSQVNTILTALQQNFKLNPVTLIPPILLLTLAALRVPTIPVLWIAILTAIPLAMWQGYDISTIVSVMAKGPQIATGVEVVDKLLNRGGVTFMASAMAVVFFAYIFAGQLEYTGVIDRISQALREKFIRDSPGRLVFATSVTGLATGLMTGNSYLSEIVPAVTFKDLYDKMRIKRTVLSRTLEDSGTVWVPLIPWAAAGIYFTQILGVPTTQYAPWAIMCYAGFITAWIYGFTGIAIWRVEEE